MRRILATLSAAALLALCSVSTASASGDPFTRSWSTIDFDGSVMTLSFGGSGDTRTVTAVDARATLCHGDAFSAVGTGTVLDDTIGIDFTGQCVSGGPGPITYGLVLTYQPTTGTLLDDGGLIWHRGTSARDAFSGVWKATDVDGSNLKLTLRGTGLARDVAYLDDYAAVCSPSFVYAASGAGLIGDPAPSGRYITVPLSGGCVGGVALDDWTALYRYDVASDTLRGPLDLGGNDLPTGTVDWHRG